MARKEFHHKVGEINVKKQRDEAEHAFLGMVVVMLPPHPYAGKVGKVDKVVVTPQGRRPHVVFDDGTWAVILNRGDANIVGMGDGRN